MSPEPAAFTEEGTPRRRYSLRNRLLASAALVLVVFLGLTGVVLESAFRNSAERAVSERLVLHIFGLLAVTEQADGEIFLPEQLQEPRLNQLASGLYALVLDAGGAEIWRSPSAVDLELDPAAQVATWSGLVAGQQRFGRLEPLLGDRLFYESYSVLWQGAHEQSTAYVFVVAESEAPWRAEVEAYRNNLWGWLLGVVVALVVVQALVMRWGLAPLGRMAEDLRAIEDGEKERLEGHYPDEVLPVTRNLNILINSEREQRDRYRTTLSDLAHSLKTPLTVLKGAIDSLDRADGDEKRREVQATVHEQVARMDQIIGYQLERAQVQSRAIRRQRTPVKPVFERLLAALAKVYEEKQLTVEQDVEDVVFLGDERDLMELAGNLLDNACKYGRGGVRVSVRGSGDNGAEPGDIELAVEDDGPGIPADQREAVLSRGARLDMQGEGQGIGLAVVNELVERYGGHCDIGRSDLGGLAVHVRLPLFGAD